MLKKRKKLSQLFLGVGQRWFDKDGPGKAAAVSFYTLFSAAPLLFFSLLIAERFIGTEQAKTSAVAWLGGFISEAEAFELVELFHLQVWEGNTLSSALIFAVILMWATSQVYVRIRLAIRDIFDEKSESAAVAFKRGLMGRLIGLGLSIVLGIVAAAGFVSVSILPSFVGMLGFDNFLSNPLFRNTWPALLLTIAGVLLIRWIPDRPPGWSATLRASSFMLVVYTLGRLLLEIYMQHSAIVSAYGAASALVVFLVWMYFSAQVFFFAVTLSEELEAISQGS